MDVATCFICCADQRIKPFKQKKTDQQSLGHAAMCMLKKQAWTPQFRRHDMGSLVAFVEERVMFCQEYAIQEADTCHSLNWNLSMAPTVATCLCIYINIYRNFKSEIDKQANSAADNDSSVSTRRYGCVRSRVWSGRSTKKFFSCVGSTTTDTRSRVSA